jgi:SPP1 gp7 family putative phage head morphogenesis protein
MNIYVAVQEFRRALLRRERGAAIKLVQAYGEAYERLSAQLDKLLKKIEAARAAGETVDQAWLFREQRYFALISQVLREIGRFADITGSIITDQQRQAVKQAMMDSERLLLTAMEASPEGISGEFNRLNKSATENLIGFLSDGSPLNTLLSRLAPEARQIVERGLINGVIQGRNPRAVAREIREGLNGNLTRALKIARTESIRSYREASHLTYQQNSEFLEGWYWLSALNSRTCRACIALHGTFHSLGERMKSHIQCRCTQVPGVKGADPGIDKGSDWFAKRPASFQKEILDNEGEYEAYKSGRLKLEDFVGLRRSLQWGDSYQALSLQRALAGEGEFPRERQRPRDLTSLIVPREEPGPRGTPVSRALKPPCSGEVARAAQRVLGTIDRLHGDGNLPEIPIVSSSSKARDAGYFYLTSSGKSVSIEVGRHAEQKEVAIAHEIGHFLDHKGVAATGHYASGEAFREFHKVVNESNAVGSLLRQFKMTVYRIKPANGPEFTHPVKKDYIRYLLSEKELWARAYCQWVALRSGDQLMLDQVRQVREDLHPGTAASLWTDDDFEPIAKAIDDLMEKLGWRKF